MENMNPNSKNTHGEAMMNKQLLQGKQQKLTVMTKKIFRNLPPDTNPTTQPTYPGGGLDWWTLD